MDLEPSSLQALLGHWTRPGTMLSAALADGIAALVASGAITHGTRLPPQRRLGEALGVSHNTVGSAYEILHLHGLLDTARCALAPRELRRSTA